ncbi:Putative chloramphenicol acetyltransferase-like domain superfamily [Septoria linicola]|uniref:Chloramphenicol acetyltransferase-like domain superfamily n=1 Tax=Septoria linicola TaxID=215465 RepID=A0A9Q9AJK4_9PEZI|nr:putative chloramphenicol acetyltransferase-like domain superfamily [Septoria linicola]USW47106.1 Putative chloramphenicol acetyltransferase-like domain superfamily [Septoria linicola]
MSWLQHYGNSDGYRWRRKDNAFVRPLGFVEFSFDTDGRHFEGRADMNCQVKLALKSNLSSEDYREKVLLAWTCLRCKHLLLRARTVRQATTPGLIPFALDGLHFAIDIHPNLNVAVESAGEHIIFVEDHYKQVDHRDFFAHCQNATRVVHPDIALAKAFVLPLYNQDGELNLRLQLVLAHQIADGISINVWMKSFIKLLNDPVDMLKAQIRELIAPYDMQDRLPPPQEALYPKVSGSMARQRWYWVIVRVLRHVRRPLPVGFANPLRRKERQAAVRFSPAYKGVLDHTKTPPLNTIPVDIEVSPMHTRRLHRLTREAKASVGAGIYAMVAVCMMELYEKLEPEIKLADRKCFITGFPLNPRAFFGFSTDPDSMMLAFSDGISLPFLSSDLSVAGRLRLLARQAQRQLSAYQKRPKAAGAEATRQFLTSRGAGLVLANQYLYGIERAQSMLPEHMRTIKVQGEYPARQNPTQQTCGVSSVGNRDLQISSGVYDLSKTEMDFVADFRGLSASVRARDGEFLVGISGTKGGLFSLPSIDMSMLDPALVEAFKHRFESILEDIEIDSDRSRL